MRSDPRPCLSARRSSDTEAVDRKVRCHKWGNKFVDNFRGQGGKAGSSALASLGVGMTKVSRGQMGRRFVSRGAGS
jgi:hypothetical protein